MIKNLTVILGPPGTGKTSRLLSILETLLTEGMKPSEIGFLAFTRKAAHEAKSRAIEKFKLDDSELIYFRTLHSFAFKMLNVDKRNIMGFLDYINICKLLGLTISSQQINEDGSLTVVHTKGDRLFFLENLARATKKTLKETWEKFPDDDIIFAELELLATTLSEYKRVREKVDFTDLIQMYLKLPFNPIIKVLIVDEAQDLSSLQWEMVEKIAADAEKVYIAGDDDQAIYSWAGADVAHFQNLRGKVEILHQSYRVPVTVFNVASDLLKRMRKRTNKAYLPRPFKGSVQRHNSLDTLNLGKGTWLMLARNIFLLGEYSQHCLSMGYLFESKYASPVSHTAIPAIKAWEALRRGELLSAAACKMVYEYLGVKTRVKFGSKKVLDAIDDKQMMDMDTLRANFGLIAEPVIWHQALNKLRPNEIQYFISALKRGERMSEDPRIKINTIHGVKGGEADNVVIVPDMSKRTYEEMQTNPDDELRVWYVAVTRAKRNLHILHPQSPYFIDI